MLSWRFALDEVAIADLRTFFQGCVCLYKNKPVLVKLISDRNIWMILDLLTQKTFSVEKPFKDISLPLRRLGMINYEGACVYAQREPFRIYQMGLNSQNTKIFKIEKMFYPTGAGNVTANLSMMDKVEVGLCLINKYPSLKEAVEHIENFNGSLAFDKQFAIGLVEDAKDFALFYKKYYVGTMDRKQPSIDRVKWKGGCEHLVSLLGEHR
jgi:hypothetical protein